MKQKYRYIVEDLETGKYLGKHYFIGERVAFFSDAFKFSAFELKLAKSTLLKPSDRYRVYAVEVEDDTTS